MSKDLRIIYLSESYIKPDVTENKLKDWVQNGRDNSYFDYVNNRYIGSPTNSAIINNYCKLIYGLGLTSEDESFDISEYISKTELKKVIKDFYCQGMAYFQVTYNRDKSINMVSHISVRDLAPQIENDENEIEGYWFCKDWKNYRKEKYTPVWMPSFGTTNNSETEIMAIRRYQYGQEYFANPTYQAGLQYAEIEEEISNFSLSHIKKGFSAGYVVSVPDAAGLTEEQKDEIERKIKMRLAGSSNAGSIVIDFHNGEQRTEVKVIEVSQSHKQWETLRDQAKEQIMTAHEVVSPMLFGVKSASGFSNNADELEEAERQTMKRVIRPLQEEITDALETILLNNDIEQKLFFIPLSEEAEQDTDQTEAADEVEVEMGKQAPKELDTELCDGLMALGEDIDLNEWELYDAQEVLNPDEEVSVKFASTGTAFPNANSEQDNEDIIIRYRYSPQKTSEDSREFCKKMVSANKVYRKEDIIRMGTKPVNAGFGEGGSDTYSIWLYKGGARCNHKWFREIYLRKGKFDVRNPNIEIISTTKARSRGYKVPTNENDVSIAPKNMDYEGFTKAYWERTFLGKLFKK